MWDYITQFWDSITGVVVDAGSYSIEWFENIGNAVAGAMGGLFDWLMHYFNDFFIFLGWIFSVITEIIQTFTLPISYVFNFIKSFTTSAFSTPQLAGASYYFSPEIKAVFDNIPNWNIMISVVGIAVSFIMAVAIFKLFLKLT